MTDLAELETPRLVLDRRILETNLQRMKARAGALGVRLRPHLKTAKCAEIARLAIGANRPITVSTLKEVDYFVEHGFRDILYAVAIAPNKLAHAAGVVRRGVKLTLILDTIAAAEVVATAAQSERVRFPVLIEIDSDGHRSGVTADDPALLDIAQRLSGSNSVVLEGVITHAGESYSCRSTSEIIEMAEQERRACVTAAEVLRRASLPCPTVSVGSTPTALLAQHLDGVTELRAGVYMFNDLTMMYQGVCGLQDIAVSVLCSVIGYSKARGALIVDAGWTALSKDQGPPHHAQQYGYGIVCDYWGTPMDGLVVISANQEHGIIGRRDAAAVDPARFPIGTRLRILPVHACATSGQYADYVVVDHSTKAVEVWQRLTGW